MALFSHSETALSRAQFLQWKLMVGANAGRGITGFSMADVTATDDLLTLGRGEVRARISRLGAELTGVSVRGQERLWNRDAQWWESIAPLLFPVVGRCFEGQLSVEGRSFPMEMHGFLSRRRFAPVAIDDAMLVLKSTSDSQTLAIYPFHHTVRVTLRLTQDGISIAAEILNKDDRVMPFCFGYHPTFPWPAGPDREDYVCRFERDEGATIRKTDGATGLLKAPLPSPLDGRTLRLRDSLFDRGMQFEDVRSRRVWFGKEGSDGVMVSFPDSHQLAIWSKAGAPLLSIEPWQGFTQEAHLGDALEKRHGVRFLAPGETERYRLDLAFDVPDPGADAPGSAAD